jgi:hypothetical protein
VRASPGRRRDRAPDESQRRAARCRWPAWDDDLT